MASDQLVDNYPGERTTTETSRLRAQHDLVVRALGDLLLCPFDTTQTDLRILDIGTADGWWLHCVRKHLTHSESAKLLGTDIAPYPDAVEEVIIHDFRTNFPKDWTGTFDLVQLRAVMASAAGDAVDVISRAIRLLKPGGYIQLVDSAMPHGEILTTDKPSIQFFKRVGNMLVSRSMVPDQGSNLQYLLATAGEGEIDNEAHRAGMVRLGKGAALESTSWDWIRGMTTVVGNGLIKLGLIEADEFARLQLAIFQEVEKEGVAFEWYAAWARKV